MKQFVAQVIVALVVEQDALIIAAVFLLCQLHPSLPPFGDEVGLCFVLCHQIAATFPKLVGRVAI